MQPLMMARNTRMLSCVCPGGVAQNTDLAMSAQRLLCTHATTLQSHSLQELSSLKSPHMDNDIPSLFRLSLPELPLTLWYSTPFRLTKRPILAHSCQDFSALLLDGSSSPSSKQ